MKLLVGGELLLYGDVGNPWGDANGFTPRDVVEALVEHGPGDVTVRLNSGGGIATDGVAIYSILLAHAGKVTVYVDGIAASAASLILMAGEKRIIRRGAMVMIHDTGTITFGNADEHRSSADTLDKLSGQYAAIYAAATGMEPDAVRALMRAETWLTADEALAQSFVTAVDDGAALPVMAFDYSLYTKAPAAFPARQQTTAALPPAPNKDPDMTKPWVDKFFAAAEKTAVPLAKLNAIVAQAETLDAAHAALITAQAEALTPPVENDPPAVDRAWAGQFFASAEKTGIPLAKLNAILAASPDFSTAQGALIDEMARITAANKPAPGGAGPLPAGAEGGARAGLAAAVTAHIGATAPHSK